MRDLLTYAFFGASLVLALGAQGCGPSAPPPSHASPVAQVPAAPAGAATESGGQSLSQSIAQAEEEAKRAGWLKKEIVEIPEPPAAIILYEPVPEQAPATLIARFDAVSAAGSDVVSGESGMIDVLKTRKGALLWDLRGDGSHHVVLHLTPCGANCGQAQPRVLELTQRGFVNAKTAPECPTCVTDVDRDRVPEFAYRMFALKVAPCARSSCGPSYALEVAVRGVESWEGGRYERGLRDFIPLYFDRLRKAKRDAKRVRSAKNKSQICPLNALRVAAESYVYGRLIGEKEPHALKTADKIMAGYTMAPCSREFDLLAPPRTWGEIRDELTKASLPKLDRRRQPQK